MSMSARRHQAIWPVRLSVGDYGGSHCHGTQAPGVAAGSDRGHGKSSGIGLLCDGNPNAPRIRLWQCRFKEAQDRDQPIRSRSYSKAGGRSCLSKASLLLRPSLSHLWASPLFWYGLNARHATCTCISGLISQSAKPIETCEIKSRQNSMTKALLNPR